MPKMFSIVLYSILLHSTLLPSVPSQWKRPGTGTCVGEACGRAVEETGHGHLRWEGGAEVAAGGGHGCVKGGVKGGVKGCVKG